jgi:type IV secretory pathway VirB10-like protein
MVQLKEKFAEMKKSIPKHVWWLLMGAAFLVVLILLVMLVTGRKADPSALNDPAEDAVLYIDPSEIEWLAVDVGETRTQKIVITASADTKISAIKFSLEVPGLSWKSTCANIGPINENVPCSITLEWAPVSETPTTVTEIQILYHPADFPDSFAQMDRVQIALAARARQPEPPAPPAPAEPDPGFMEPAPYVPEPAPIIPEPEPVPLAPLISDQTITEACYEYAFAGYDNAGNHSGWIRASGGRYLYHPFSDTTCSNPSGDYNLNTGMITALSNPSQKIGSDAEHVGWGISGSTLAMPVLSNPATAQTINRARQLDAVNVNTTSGSGQRLTELAAPPPTTNRKPSSMHSKDGEAWATISSAPYDRTFVLRQYKPIPATMVSEIRATKDASRLPVQATVDRNVYSDNGRTVIVPAGTLMIGAVSDADMPGPYKSIGRVNIEWFRFVRPDGVEFNFVDKHRPFSADSQGRTGVPGRGSTDYLEQFVMPMLTAIVPAAVNLIAPISDRFVNQIDLDNNTIVQSGTVRSSELAKNEIITTWNKVAEKLAIDMFDNQTPPFSIAAGTRITVFSPTDLIVTCGDPEKGDTRNCAVTVPDNSYASVPAGGFSASGEKISIGASPDNIASNIGQVRAYMQNIGTENINDARVRAFMDSMVQYEAKNTAAWNEYYKQADAGNATTSIPKQGTPAYNEQVLGLKYNEQGQVANPFEKEKKKPVETGLTCEDGTNPNANGCCAGEVYTDMGDQGFNCCPSTGGDCFPPIL